MLEGDLADFSLPEVLQLLGATAKSGHLEVTDGRRTGTVDLVAGRVRAVRGETAGTGLLRRLLDGGAVDLLAAEPVVSQLGEQVEEETVLRALREAGALEESALAAARRARLLEAVAGLGAMAEGAFRFRPGEPAEPQSGDVPAAELLAAAEHHARLRSLATVRAGLATDSVGAVRAPAAPPSTPASSAPAVADQAVADQAVAGQGVADHPGGERDGDEEADAPSWVPVVEAAGRTDAQPDRTAVDEAQATTAAAEPDWHDWDDEDGPDDEPQPWASSVPAAEGPAADAADVAGSSAPAEAGDPADADDPADAEDAARAAGEPGTQPAVTDEQETSTEHRRGDARAPAGPVLVGEMPAPPGAGPAAATAGSGRTGPSARSRGDLPVDVDDDLVNRLIAGIQEL